MPICYLSFGSNLGKREEKIQSAFKELGNSSSIKLLKKASTYETIPVGPGKQSKYLNTVAKIRTDFAPLKLLEYIKQVELKLGRKKRIRWEPRQIDIDILFYGKEIIKSKLLTIPHPRLHDRDFVLRPLVEIAPSLRHPVLDKTIKELLDENNKKYK